MLILKQIKMVLISVLFSSAQSLLRLVVLSVIIGLNTSSYVLSLGNSLSVIDSLALLNHFCNQSILTVSILPLMRNGIIGRLHTYAFENFITSPVIFSVMLLLLNFILSIHICHITTIPNIFIIIIWKKLKNILSPDQSGFILRFIDTL